MQAHHSLTSAIAICTSSAPIRAVSTLRMARFISSATATVAQSLSVISRSFVDLDQLSQDEKSSATKRSQTFLAAPHMQAPEHAVICDRLEGVAVPLKCGLFAYVDEADAALVLAHRWHVHRSDHRVYAIRREGSTRKLIFMHRMLLDAARGEIIDHRDGDGLNNRRGNLRRATNQQNCCNSRAKGAVPLQGVRRIGDRFAASIWPDGSHVNLGTSHASPEAASALYNAAALVIYGEFARVSHVKPDFEGLAAIAARKLSGYQYLVGA
jgi:hypothetical protein